ncbi:MAG: LacI family DNA-binding transcriptional regulator [Paenibacillaceae bacterium]
MNITIADLAKITEFARSTISGVLNNKPGFSAKTREKVLAAAEQYGYVPNEIARGLSSKYTKTIGLIIKDITNPFYNQITKGVQEVAAENGFTVFLCSSGEEHQTEVAQVKAMMGKRVDGLIIAPLLEDVTFDHIFELKRKGLPFALLGKIPGLECDLVEFDDYSGGKQAIEHLLQNGHVKVGFISGLWSSKASKQRYMAFKDTMLQNGLQIDPNYLFSNVKDLSDGMEIGEQLIRQKNRPTAMICFDDVIAMGVIKAFDQAGLKVPDDLSIIGFDNIDLVIFPLTTVFIPTYKAGRALAETLIERILNESTGEYKHITFDEELVVRSSVKNTK